jgi:hypothetical protein
MNLFEIVEPEIRVAPARVILNKRQLRPAHGLSKPGFFIRLQYAGYGVGSTQCNRTSYRRAVLNEISSIQSFLF